MSLNETIDRTDVYVRFCVTTDHHSYEGKGHDYIQSIASAFKFVKIE